MTNPNLGGSGNLPNAEQRTQNAEFRSAVYKEKLRLGLALFWHFLVSLIAGWHMFHIINR